MTARTSIFHPVGSVDDIEEVVALAQIIWVEHYVPIIGADQVRYMLDTYHSRSAVTDEIENQGFQFFLIRSDGRDVGYFSFQSQDDGLYLSKLYVLSSERGKGTGKQVLEFIKREAAYRNLPKITLIVNRGNGGSIAAYEKIGFLKTGNIKADIGSGFVMDDISMSLSVG